MTLDHLYALYRHSYDHYHPETARTLARAFEKRQNSDYEDFATVDPADA